MGSRNATVLNRDDRLHWWPFPHVVIHDALPRALFDALAESFPLDAIMRDQDPGENKRIDLPIRRATELPLLWQDFVYGHATEAFWRKAATLFAHAIHLHYAELEERWGPMMRWTVTPRGMGNAQIRIDCQPGVNTPLTEAGRVKGPHLDNPVELIAGLLYFGDPGDLVLYREVAKPEFFGKLEVSDECVSPAVEVRADANTLVMFLNTDKSFHGVTPREPTDQFRRLVNIAIEVGKPLFDVPR